MNEDTILVQGPILQVDFSTKMIMTPMFQYGLVTVVALRMLFETCARSSNELYMFLENIMYSYEY